MFKSNTVGQRGALYKRWQTNSQGAFINLTVIKMQKKGTFKQMTQMIGSRETDEKILNWKRNT